MKKHNQLAKVNQCYQSAASIQTSNRTLKNKVDLHSKPVNDLPLSQNRVAQVALSVGRNRRSNRKHSCSDTASSVTDSCAGIDIGGVDEEFWRDSSVRELLDEYDLVREGILVVSPEKRLILEGLWRTHHSTIPFKISGQEAASVIRTSLFSLPVVHVNDEEVTLVSDLTETVPIHYRDVECVIDCPVHDVRHWGLWKFLTLRSHVENDYPSGALHLNSVTSYLFGPPLSTLPLGRPYVVQSEVDKQIVSYCLSKFRGVSLQSTGAGRAWFYPCSQKFPDVDVEVLNNSVRYAFQKIERMQELDRASGLGCSVPRGMPN